MKCRSCGGNTELVLSLGEMPLPNRLLYHPTEPCAKYPVELMFCSMCKLGQLAEVIQPVLMFHDYPYYSSVSKPTVDSATELVTRIREERGLSNNHLVVEIGSNDGYLLDVYRKPLKTRSGDPQYTKVQVLGIDPASGPANVAALRGIPTVQEFFTLKLARTLPMADVIHAHNILAHVPDLNDFVAGVAQMLKDDGIVVVEVPYLGDMVDKCTFDTIYAEHSYYFSITAIRKLFERHGLGVTRVERITAHGGSLRIIFYKAPTVNCYPREHFDFAEMAQQIRRIDCALDMFLDSCKGQKRVWGFGAAAKATVMLNYCGFDTTFIEAVADATPAKIGRFIPGTGIPIVSTQDWLKAQPEYTCIFAWNYANEICQRYVTSYHGKFFTPYILPEVSVPA